MQMVSPHSQSKQIFFLASPLVWMSALPSALHLLHPKVAHAAGKEIALKGWDLYGRVPYDDFLFTNDKLLDPNFLRKSFVESVAYELPIAYGAFRRAKFIGEIKSMVTRGAMFVTGVTVLGLLALLLRNNYSRFQKREIDLMGFSSPTSARYKNRNYSGRKIDSVEGFVDMSRGLNFEEQAQEENSTDNEEDEESAEE
jgi:hypothetical protein